MQKGNAIMAIIGFFVVILIIVFIIKESFVGGILNPSQTTATTITKVYKNINECPNSIDIINVKSLSEVEEKLNEMLPCRYTNGCSVISNNVFRCVLTGFY